MPFTLTFRSPEHWERNPGEEVSFFVVEEAIALGLWIFVSVLILTSSCVDVV